ncbi:MAG: DUF748 domain-containing protein [Desulfuromonas sp.]|nr:DUF748 domain-containing protein [Desulfuromonas sp.]
MSRWLRRSLITLVVTVGLLLLSMLIVPWQLKKQGAAWIATNTARTLSIEKVYFNPFILKLEISGLKLTEPDSTEAFVSCSRVLVSASLRSIIDQALILRRIEVEHPYVKIDLLGQNSFNFSDFMQLGDDSAEVPAAELEDAKPFLFSFNNIVITSGEIDFNDQASPQSSHHEIRQLQLSIPVLGNVAYQAGEYVTPELSLLLNGADIHAQGQSKPFDNSLATQLLLSLRNTDLAFYAQHAPVPLPVAVQSAVLDGDVSLNYLVSGGELPQLLISGAVDLSAIAVDEPSGAPLLAMDSLRIQLDKADVFRREINVTAIELDAPQLWVTRAGDGKLNLQSLFAAEEVAPAAPAEAAPTTAELPLLVVNRFSLHHGQIHFSDEALSTPVTEHVDQLELVVDNLSTHPDAQAAVHLDVHTANQVTLAVDGSLGVVPAQAQLQCAVTGVKLETYYPYLEQILTAPIAGQLELSTRVSYVDANTSLSAAALTLRELRVPFAGEDQFTLRELKLADCAADVALQQLHLGQIHLSGGDVKVTRLEDGTFTPLQLLRDSAAAAPAPKVARDETASAPWTLDVASFDLDKFRVQLRDRTQVKKPLLVVQDFAVHAEDLSYPQARTSPFELSAKVGKKGTVRVDGTLVHTPLQLSANTRIGAFPLADFNDFIPENLQLKVKDGQLSSKLKLRLNQHQEQLQANFSGQLGLNRFNLHATNGGELISWDSLDVAGIQGSLAPNTPFALHIKEVALSNYKTNIEIADNGQINLTSVTTPQEGAAAPVAADGQVAGAVEPAQSAAAQPGGAGAKSASAPADIRIDAVTLQGGRVSFTDRHLPSTFATTMYDLGGRITGLSSNEQMQADVDLRGQLENHSPLTIRGKINPLTEDLFADLTISFKDIDLSPLTPYSGNFLGYAIDKGKLYLDLIYHIEHQDIRAENRVMIDQFTFGDTIDSADATSLPVALAISLLKDRNEEIHLNIPISGNLNDPDFSLAGTIFTVLRNLVMKAATSPFALLTSMVGSGADVSSISFALGHADLSAEQAEKLTGLADILSNRPSLTLDISAFVDKANDPDAYRQLQLTRMLQAVKWRELDDEQRSTTTRQNLSIGADEYPKLLKKVYKEAEFPRPRNVLGLLKSLPPAEMEKLLLANVRAGEEELAALANARAMSVRDGLIAINAELKPRLFLMTSDIYAPAQEGVASRVEFGISAK